MQELKKLNVLSIAKISGLFGILLGIRSIIVSKISCAASAEQALMYGINCTGLTAGTMILGIIMSGLIYFVTGAIVAIFYNLFSKWIGGVKIELSKETK